MGAGGWEAQCRAGSFQDLLAPSHVGFSRLYQLPAFLLRLLIFSILTDSLPKPGNDHADWETETVGKYITHTVTQADKVAPWVKAPATKFEDKSAIFKTHMAEREKQFPEVVPWPLHMHRGMHVSS